jgi:ElaB/YqjD/DUF883 family membrane-anchored ribosome-binding protein
MSSPASSLALVQDKILPLAVDRLQTLVERLERSLQPAARDAGSLIAQLTERTRRIRPTPLGRIGGAASRVALFARANPALAVGVVAGAGLLLGLASLGAGRWAKARRPDPDVDDESLVGTEASGLERTSRAPVSRSSPTAE